MRKSSAPRGLSANITALPDGRTHAEPGRYAPPAQRALPTLSSSPRSTCSLPHPSYSDETCLQHTHGRSHLADMTLSYREGETNALLHLFSAATPSAKTFGRGPGFAFVSKDVGLDDEGNLAPRSATNYIHNFYLFLLLKLGLFGAAVLLVLLALWIGWTVQETRASRREPQKTFLTAASAVWSAAVIWNLVCPEFIDFRMAPLWGLLIAATVNAAEQRDRSTVGAA
jgi:hypothetical protein